ncbi:multiple sugar transport system permease protein [Paenibacillus sp. UNC496MF]|uniref:carbohydrate ABC transporter permease n=1 Tax=Paenibacillus sp. UNC496MF TaxID=1502753 RepID=UPI0008E91FD2|nr:carbohydrate ABC transporter permease [Paenibacillus sp. UNC496MF]SFI79734.1 multiple sugar transport system permease protein [Paenibacillus sp. UNC496MF]
MKSKKLDIPYILLFTTMLIASALMFIPYLWMALLSVKSNMEIMMNPTALVPENPTVEGYRTVLQEAPFMRWFMNSVITSAIITIGLLFSSSLAGYIFAKFHFRGSKTILVVIMATMMVPFQVVMIPIYLIISRLGLINHLAAIVIPSLVGAFGIYLCKQFIEGIPKDLIEASRIDGASETRTYASLILPQITPVLSALGIFTFMGAWNNYLWPLIVLNDESKMTVPLALVFFNSRHTVNYNVVMSAAVLIMIPVIIVFLIFQKQFVKGLTLTGIK